MEDTADNTLHETWARLILLLFTQPRKGWEPGFQAITRREIEGPAVPASASERHE